MRRCGALALLVVLVLKVTVAVQEDVDDDEPPPAPRLEDEPEPPTKPQYPGPGVWAKPAADSGIDLGFVPIKLYATKRHTETVRLLPRSAAFAEASTPEEVAAAPRLRQVLSSKKIQEVYSEEGYGDSAYDHGGYGRNAEQQEDYERGAPKQSSRRHRPRHRDYDDAYAAGSSHSESTLPAAAAAAAAASAAPKQPFEEGRLKHRVSHSQEITYAVTQVRDVDAPNPQTQASELKPVRVKIPKVLFLVKKTARMERRSDDGIEDETEASQSEVKEEDSGEALLNLEEFESRRNNAPPSTTTAPAVTDSSDPAAQASEAGSPPVWSEEFLKSLPLQLPGTETEEESSAEKEEGYLPVRALAKPALTAKGPTEQEKLWRLIQKTYAIPLVDGRPVQPPHALKSSSRSVALNTLPPELITPTPAPPQPRGAAPVYENIESSQNATQDAQVPSVGWQPLVPSSDTPSPIQKYKYHVAEQQLIPQSKFKPKEMQHWITDQQIKETDSGNIKTQDDSTRITFSLFTPSQEDASQVDNVDIQKLNETQVWRAIPYFHGRVVTDNTKQNSSENNEPNIYSSRIPKDQAETSEIATSASSNFEFSPEQLKESTVHGVLPYYDPKVPLPAPADETITKVEPEEQPQKTDHQESLRIIPPETPTRQDYAKKDRAETQSHSTENFRENDGTIYRRKEESKAPQTYRRGNVREEPQYPYRNDDDNENERYTSQQSEDHEERGRWGFVPYYESKTFPYFREQLVGKIKSNDESDKKEGTSSVPFTQDPNIPENEEPKGINPIPREYARAQSRENSREQPRQYYSGHPADIYHREPSEAFHGDPREAHRGEPRESIEDEPRQEYRTESKETYREDPKKEYNEQSNEEYHEQPREKYQEKTREEDPEQSRKEYSEQPREDYNEQPRDDYREQPSDNYRKQPRVDYREQPREDNREEPRVDYRDQPREDYREQTRRNYNEQPREDYRESPTEDNSDQPRKDYREQSVDFRKHPREQYREQPRDNFQKHPREEYYEESRGGSQEESKYYREPTSGKYGEERRESLHQHPAVYDQKQPIRDEYRQKPREDYPLQSSKLAKEHPRDDYTEQPERAYVEKPSAQHVEKPTEDYYQQPNHDYRGQLRDEYRGTPRDHIKEVSREHSKERTDVRFREQPYENSAEHANDYVSGHSPHAPTTIPAQKPPEPTAYHVPDPPPPPHRDMTSYVPIKQTSSSGFIETPYVAKEEIRHEPVNKDKVPDSYEEKPVEVIPQVNSNLSATRPPLILTDEEKETLRQLLVIPPPPKEVLLPSNLQTPTPLVFGILPKSQKPKMYYDQPLHFGIRPKSTPPPPLSYLPSVFVPNRILPMSSRKSNVTVNDTVGQGSAPEKATVTPLPLHQYPEEFRSSPVTSSSVEDLLHDVDLPPPLHSQREGWAPTYPVLASIPSELMSRYIPLVASGPSSMASLLSVLQAEASKDPLSAVRRSDADASESDSVSTNISGESVPMVIWVPLDTSLGTSLVKLQEFPFSELPQAGVASEQPELSDISQSSVPTTAVLPSPTTTVPPTQPTESLHGAESGDSLRSLWSGPNLLAEPTQLSAEGTDTMAKLNSGYKRIISTIKVSNNDSSSLNSTTAPSSDTNNSTISPGLNKANTTDAYSTSVSVSGLPSTDIPSTSTAVKIQTTSTTANAQTTSTTTAKATTTKSRTRSKTRKIPSSTENYTDTTTEKTTSTTTAESSTSPTADPASPTAITGGKHYHLELTRANRPQSEQEEPQETEAPQNATQAPRGAWRAQAVGGGASAGGRRSLMRDGPLWRRRRSRTRRAASYPSSAQEDAAAAAEAARAEAQADAEVARDAASWRDALRDAQLRLPAPHPTHDPSKYPFYERSKQQDKARLQAAASGAVGAASGGGDMGTLRYALDPASAPRKTPGGMEFYASRERVHCPDVSPSLDILPKRSEDGEWNKQPLVEGPRLGGLGDKIDCLKVKYWGEEPLDNPLFLEEEVAADPAVALAEIAGGVRQMLATVPARINVIKQQHSPTSDPHVTRNEITDAYPKPSAIHSNHLVAEATAPVPVTVRPASPKPPRRCHLRRRRPSHKTSSSDREELRTASTRYPNGHAAVYANQEKLRESEDARRNSARHKPVGDESNNEENGRVRHRGSEFTTSGSSSDGRKYVAHDNFEGPSDNKYVTGKHTDADNGSKEKFEEWPVDERVNAGNVRNSHEGNRNNNDNGRHHVRQEEFDDEVARDVSDDHQSYKHRNVERHQEKKPSNENVREISGKNPKEKYEFEDKSRQLNERKEYNSGDERRTNGNKGEKHDINDEEDDKQRYHRRKQYREEERHRSEEDEDEKGEHRNNKKHGSKSKKVEGRKPYLHIQRHRDEQQSNNQNTTNDGSNTHHQREEQRGESTTNEKYNDHKTKEDAREERKREYKKYIDTQRRQPSSSKSDSISRPLEHSKLNDEQGNHEEILNQRDNRPHRHHIHTENEDEPQGKEHKPHLERDDLRYDKSPARLREIYDEGSNTPKEEIEDVNPHALRESDKKSRPRNHQYAVEENHEEQSSDAHSPFDHDGRIAHRTPIDVKQTDASENTRSQSPGPFVKNGHSKYPAYQYSTGYSTFEYFPFGYPSSYGPHGSSTSTVDKPYAHEEKQGLHSKGRTESGHADHEETEDESESVQRYKETPRLTKEQYLASLTAAGYDTQEQPNVERGAQIGVHPSSPSFVGHYTSEKGKYNYPYFSHSPNTKYPTRASALPPVYLTPPPFPKVVKAYVGPQIVQQYRPSYAEPSHRERAPQYYEGREEPPTKSKNDYSEEQTGSSSTHEGDFRPYRKHRCRDREARHEYPEKRESESRRSEYLEDDRSPYSRNHESETSSRPSNEKYHARYRDPEQHDSREKYINSDKYRSESKQLESDSDSSGRSSDRPKSPPKSFGPYTFSSESPDSRSWGLASLKESKTPLWDYVVSERPWRGVDNPWKVESYDWPAKRIAMEEEAKKQKEAKRKKEEGEEEDLKERKKQDSEEEEESQSSRKHEREEYRDDESSERNPKEKEEYEEEDRPTPDVYNHRKEYDDALKKQMASRPRSRQGYVEEEHSRVRGRDPEDVPRRPSRQRARGDGHRRKSIQNRSGEFEEEEEDERPAPRSSANAEFEEEEEKDSRPRAEGSRVVEDVDRVESAEGEAAAESEDPLAMAESRMVAAVVDRRGRPVDAAELRAAASSARGRGVRASRRRDQIEDEGASASARREATPDESWVDARRGEPRYARGESPRPQRRAKKGEGERGRPRIRPRPATTTTPAPAPLPLAEEVPLDEEVAADTQRPRPFQEEPLDDAMPLLERLRGAASWLTPTQINRVLGGFLSSHVPTTSTTSTTTTTMPPSPQDKQLAVDENLAEVRVSTTAAPELLRTRPSNKAKAVPSPQNDIIPDRRKSYARVRSYTTTTSTTTAKPTTKTAPTRPPTRPTVRTTTATTTTSSTPEPSTATAYTASRTSPQRSPRTTTTAPTTAEPPPTTVRPHRTGGRVILRPASQRGTTTTTEAPESTLPVRTKNRTWARSRSSSTAPPSTTPPPPPTTTAPPTRRNVAVQTRRVTKEEIFTRTYIPDPEDDEDELEGDPGLDGSHELEDSGLSARRYRPSSAEDTGSPSDSSEEGGSGALAYYMDPRSRRGYWAAEGEPRWGEANRRSSTARARGKEEEQADAPRRAPPRRDPLPATSTPAQEVPPPPRSGARRTAAKDHRVVDAEGDVEAETAASTEAAAAAVDAEERARPSKPAVLDGELYALSRLLRTLPEAQREAILRELMDVASASPSATAGAAPAPAAARSAAASDDGFFFFLPEDRAPAPPLRQR